MKRNFKKVLLFISVILLSFFSFKTFAQTASSTTQINAEVLTNIWYSTTTINENDNINIYAGFQNHSTKNLSLTAGFFIDDVQIGKADYVASPKSLIKLSSAYTAEKGGHTAQAKILDIAEVGGSNIDKLSVDNLLAKESEKNSFNVIHQITQQEVINTAKDIANTVADTVSKTTDSVVKTVNKSFLFQKRIGFVILNLHLVGQFIYSNKWKIFYPHINLIFQKRDHC